VERGEELAGEGGHALWIGRAVDLGGEIEDGGAEEVLGGLDGVGDGGGGGAEEGAEASGFELDAEDPAPAFEMAGELSGADSGELGCHGGEGVDERVLQVLLKEEVDVGVGEGLLQAGADVTEVPLDHPEVLDPWCEGERRGDSTVKELASGWA